jgi:hypothetical protein
MSATYFWSNDQVVVLDRRIFKEDFNQSSMFKFLYCPCVDGFADDILISRYGAWENEGGGWVARATWRPMKPDDLPPEFRTHLLLLGVS